MSLPEACPQTATAGGTVSPGVSIYRHWIFVAEAAALCWEGEPFGASIDSMEEIPLDSSGWGRSGMIQGGSHNGLRAPASENHGTVNSSVHVCQGDLDPQRRGWTVPALLLTLGVRRHGSSLLNIVSFELLQCVVRRTTCSKHWKWFMIITTGFPQPSHNWSFAMDKKQHIFCFQGH